MKVECAGHIASPAMPAKEFPSKRVEKPWKGGNEEGWARETFVG